MPLEPTALSAISPIDGRYRRATHALSDYFSEGALIRYRLQVEVEYFIALCQIPLPELNAVDAGNFESLRRLVKAFTPEDAQRVKEIEAVTNHDVKAVEYFLKERFEQMG
ncbi:MAG: adenylosuccinate lyase, partial [Desulfobacteraceae bacterium]|nr:adenylosuccinate lyase [Desulfobacteraceae bacterium]